MLLLQCMKHHCTENTAHHCTPSACTAPLTGMHFAAHKFTAGKKPFLLKEFMYLKIGNFITKEDPSSTVNLVSVMVSEALHLCPLKKFDPTAAFRNQQRTLPGKKTARDQNQRKRQRRLLCKEVLLGERRKG